jgi:hypothetical protein
MSARLSHAIALYRLLSNSRVERASAYGTIVLSGETRAALREVQAHGDFLDEGQLGQPDGSEAEVEFVLPRSSAAFFAEDWAELLKHDHFRFRRPDDFFVANDGYRDGAPDTHSSKRYRAILEFIALLSDVADHLTSSDELRLVYLQKEKLELSIVYGESDMRDIPSIGTFVEDFKNDAKKHREQRAAIIKTVLTDMLRPVSPETRFTALLAQCPQFFERVRDSYALYVSEFSFERVMQDIEGRRLDFTTKLNKVFSDIQNQLLAVPAALLFVASQVTNSSRFEWKNALTLLGVVIFWGFMVLLIRNQRHTLEAIKSDLDREQIAIRLDHAESLTAFQQIYQLLGKRYRQQKWLLRAVFWTATMVLLVTLILFILFTADATWPVKVWLHGRWPKVFV